MSKAMRSTIVALTCVILVSARPSIAQHDASRAVIEATVRSLEAGEVGTMDTLRIPDDVLFRVNVNPERLESWWRYRFTSRDLGPRTQELAVALKTASIQPSSTKLESLDVRWGIIFYSKTPEGNRILSLYFDRAGRQGAINNVPASFGPDFFPRLKKALHASIE